jgi:chemotaxis protein CheZ
MSVEDKAAAVLRTQILQIIYTGLQKTSALRDLCVDALHVRIPQSNDEIKAIKNLSEETAHAILGSCENIQKLLVARNISTPELKVEVNNIIVNCSFQDITQQRVKKILKLMDNLSDDLKKLLGAIDGTLSNIAHTRAEKVPLTANQKLLQGPGEGLSQKDVDVLLEQIKKGEGL